jgi:hypothetical protein
VPDPRRIRAALRRATKASSAARHRPRRYIPASRDRRSNLSGNREAIAKLCLHDLEEILAATLTGMSVDEFEAEADFMFSAVFQSAS